MLLSETMWKSVIHATVDAKGQGSFFCSGTEPAVGSQLRMRDICRIMLFFLELPFILLSISRHCLVDTRDHNGCSELRIKQEAALTLSKLLLERGDPANR